jgi:hypothetical protein
MHGLMTDADLHGDSVLSLRTGIGQMVCLRARSMHFPAGRIFPSLWCHSASRRYESEEQLFLGDSSLAPFGWIVWASSWDSLEAQVCAAQLLDVRLIMLEHGDVAFDEKAGLRCFGFHSSGLLRGIPSFGRRKRSLDSGFELYDKNYRGIADSQTRHENSHRQLLNRRMELPS